MFRLLSLTFGAIIAMLALAKGITSPAGPVSDSPQIADEASSKPHIARIEAQDNPDTGPGLEVRRDATGQFHLTAQVNGQDAQFLIDTGADAVALSIDEAERLGVPVNRTGFVPIARTASGTANGARVHLDRITVAGTEFTDIDAMVVEGLDVNLLGQTVLRRLGKVELHGDVMRIGGPETT